MYYRTPTSIHPGAPIKLSSQILLSTTAEIKSLDQQQRATSEEYRVLAQKDRPDIRAQTNTSYTKPATHATIDTSGPSIGPGKTETSGATNEAEQRSADVARLLAGEALEEIPDIRTRMNQLARKAAAIEVAKEKKQDDFRAEHQKLSAAYCAKLKPDHDAKTKQFLKLFGEAFAIFSELQKTKRDLIDSEIGFGGLFGVDLDFLRGEEVKSMFADAKAQGFISSVPREFA